MHRFSDRAGFPDGSRIAPPTMLPSACLNSVGTPKPRFRGSIAGLHDPYRRFAAVLANGRRTAQGHRGSLLLRCRELSSPAPRRFIPALSQTSVQPSTLREPPPARGTEDSTPGSQRRHCARPDPAVRAPHLGIEFAQERASRPAMADAWFATRLSHKPSRVSPFCAFATRCRFCGEPFQPRRTGSGRLSRCHEVGKDSRCQIRTTCLVCATASDASASRQRHGRAVACARERGGVVVPGSARGGPPAGSRLVGVDRRLPVILSARWSSSAARSRGRLLRSRRRWPSW